MENTHDQNILDQYALEQKIHAQISRKRYNSNKKFVQVPIQLFNQLTGMKIQLNFKSLGDVIQHLFNNFQNKLISKDTDPKFKFFETEVFSRGKRKKDYQESDFTGFVYNESFIDIQNQNPLSQPSFSNENQNQNTENSNDPLDHIFDSQFENSNSQENANVPPNIETDKLMKIEDKIELGLNDNDDNNNNNNDNLY
ncbi:hypothetical protein M0811_06556 [Anaeramoeba ignava]|uniref:Uncharacterized protein n=1 Tax=Anaeramoeba ignava TaxID=1746090 RepID=A0A9Q0LNN3_ANAIG|nr:hypothetical protein M0811_06556 [Anaeramoeba ignava]